MDNRIKELIERTARSIYADWGFGTWATLMEAERGVWLRTARKVLKDKDLALIHRGIPDIGKEQDEKARLQVLPVIPLAGALKEANND